MKKQLRKIQLHDIVELSSMLKDFWSTQLTEASDQDVLEDIGRMLSKKGLAYLIIYDSNIAGFIFVYDKYGYVNNIEYLYIKEEYRGKGLASFALRAVMEKVLEKGSPRVQIEVSPYNRKGLKLYHRLGFNHVDTLSLSTSLPGKKRKMEFSGLEFYANPESEFN